MPYDFAREMRECRHDRADNENDKYDYLTDGDALEDEGEDETANDEELPR